MQMKLKRTIAWVNKSVYGKTDECLDLQTVLNVFFTNYTLSTVLFAVDGIGFSIDVLMQVFVKLELDELLRFGETS